MKFYQKYQKKLPFYSNFNFWEKLNIWSESSQKMKYIPAIHFDILFARISYVSFKPWNVQRLSANNFNKNQFWENRNGNFVQLNIMTIFTTLYEILGITGGEIDLRLKAGATVECRFFPNDGTVWVTLPKKLITHFFPISPNKWRVWTFNVINRRKKNSLSHRP